jgi:hypothetical protein
VKVAVVTTIRILFFRGRGLEDDAASCRRDSIQRPTSRSRGIAGSCSCSAMMIVVDHCLV